MRINVGGVHDARKPAGGRRAEALLWLSAVGCIVTLALTILLAPLASDGHAAAKVPRIGVLLPTTADAALLLEPFRQGLRERNYVEGQDIAIAYRIAERDDQLLDLATELVQLKVDIIVVWGTPSAKAAQHATRTIPIVAGMGDPVEMGLVASLARPGGNLTGVSYTDPAFMGKRLELLKEAVPGVTRVAYLWHAMPFSARALQETERAARTLGVQLSPVEVRDPYPFDEAFATMAEAHADALLMQPSPQFFTRRTQIVDLAVKMRLPGIFEVREFAEAGGLMAYGPPIPVVFRRAATYVDKILKGAKPADLPVEYPMKFELVINLKTAQAFGITIPPTLLILADEVIR